MSKIKSKIAVLTALFFVLMVGLVAGAVEAPQEVVLNVDYGDFNDEDQDTISVKGTIALNNTGANETVSLDITGLPSDYEFTKVTGIALPANAAKNVEFTVKVPHDKGEGNTTIGTVKVLSSANTELASVALVQDTKSMLELDEIQVDYYDKKDNSETDDFSDKNDDSYELGEKVKPGTEVEIEIKLRNLFSSKYDRDGQLENVKITIEADDDDIFEDSFEEDYDLDDIDAGKKESLTVSFTVDEEAENEDYTFDITIEAEDGKNNEYKIEKELSLELGRERDDIQITKFDVMPKELTTCDTQFSVNVEAKNTGTDDQKHAGVTIYNKVLDVNENVFDLRLERFDDRDNSWESTFTYSLPKDVKAGTYNLDVRTYVDKTKVKDVQIKKVVIKDCAAKQKTTTPEPKEETKKEVKQPTTTQPKENPVEKVTKTIASGQIVQTVEDPYSKEDFFVGLLLVLIVVVIAVIIIFFIVLLK